jgi:hypothetical protein
VNSRCTNIGPPKRYFSDVADSISLSLWFVSSGALGILSWIEVEVEVEVELKMKVGYRSIDGL